MSFVSRIRLRFTSCVISPTFFLFPPGGDDKEIKLDEKRLMKVSDASGKIKLTEVATGDKLSRNLLDSDDVFLLDDGYEVMVYGTTFPIFLLGFFRPFSPFFFPFSFFSPPIFFPFHFFSGGIISRVISGRMRCMPAPTRAVWHALGSREYSCLSDAVAGLVLWAWYYFGLRWIGLGASSGERKNAMSIAQKYLNDYNLPKDKGISKIMEGGENEQFEQVLSFFFPSSSLR